MRQRQPAAAAPAQAQSPVIRLWYGLEQAFGKPGLPQDRINLLGNLSPSAGFRLEYQINGSAFQPVTLGGTASSNVRLVNAGDFNIELFDPNYNRAQARIDVLPELLLKAGLNVVVLRAVEDGSGDEVNRQEVVVDYTPLGASSWPLPFEVDWGSANGQGPAAQVVDGLWDITAGGTRITQPGYDRLIAIGDVLWDDYEVLTSFTIHEADSGLQGGIGVILGWHGHYRRGTESPTAGWTELGAYGYYSFRLGQRLVLRIDESEGQLGPPVAYEAGGRYHLRIQVESDPDNAQVSYYRVKMWKDGEAEPAGWGVERTDPADTRPHGAVLLVAHLVDATFGNVIISPLQAGTCYSLAVSASGLGSVQRSPQKPCYAPGETVTLTAVPASGYVFQHWTVDGEPGESSNPLDLTMSANRTVQASFVPLPPFEGNEKVFIPLVMR